MELSAEEASLLAMAAEWLARLRDKRVTPAEKSLFEAWLAEDPAHAAAWHEVQRMWKSLARRTAR